MRTPATILSVLLAVALGGCASESGVSPATTDANPTTDAGANDAMGCETHITFDPPIAIAGPSERVRAIATVGSSPGVPTYQWQVKFGAAILPFEDARADHSEITFPTTSAGVYEVSVAVNGGAFCPYALENFNVGTGGTSTNLRLAVRAPGAPPQERSLVFSHGVTSFAFGNFALDPGVVTSGFVRSGVTGVPSYLRFIPHGRPDQVVEAFAGATGAFTVTILDEIHDVLVVPMVAGYAPRLISNYASTDTLIAVETGLSATGVVHAPSGAALAGATVQVRLDGVPSTLTATTLGGAFAVAYQARAGALIEIEVVPPAGSGLPRLVASSAAFDLTQAIVVDYAAALATRDLAGTRIARGASDVATTRVDVVGTIGGAGQISTGATMASAAGTFRAVATTSATGILPTLRVPATPMKVVAEIAPADVAVVALDLAGVIPASIAMPVVPVHATTIVDLVGTPLVGVHVTLVPRGELALAALPPLELVTTTGGAVGVPYAVDGSYDLRIDDPAGRGAPTQLTDLSPTLAASIALPAAVVVTGTIKQSGNPNPVVGASVQVLCKACIGVDRTRPIAQAASDLAGRFTLVVPDLP
ncbi:MAG: hypothetical protein NT062_01770 [Proteobacteria bacterium]|nr:hypothetical protein [Pseudomonadota bacterium]